jgi:hypothetical protein
MNPIDELVVGVLYPFVSWPNSAVPISSAGVYSIWDSEGALIYVGMSGRGMSNEHLVESQSIGRKRGLYTRLSSHASGARSGDQFCVYVADRLVLPTLTREQIKGISEKAIAFDHLVRDYIHTYLSFRFAITHDGEEASILEREARSGALGSLPFLNPLVHRSI